MSRPKLLDLFSGAGGAAVGYHRAGFDVVGVDHRPQPRYPFDFVQLDALDALDALLPDGRGGSYCLADFDAIHASPPCQRHSIIVRNKGTSRSYPELVGPTRELLAECGLPYVIENVVGAPLINPVRICGASLNLSASGMDLHRHRLFECSFPALGVPCARQHSLSMGVYGKGTNSWHHEKLGRNLTVAEMRTAMGIDWMPRSSLNQAIPPAYTCHIGEYLRREVERRAALCEVERRPTQDHGKAA